ncbi:hypothetical protein J3459_008237 [Metarhizium acridum]|nr:hypothetical protein J3459_008237 [Metarhizium acridum]
MAVATDKSWILTRSPTYRPTGALRLGQVLTDPRQPASSLFATESSYVQIPDNYILEDGELRGVSLEMDSKPVSSSREWAKVHGASISANLHAESSKESRRQGTIKTLEYRHFIRELEYIRNVLKAGDVPEVTQW